MPKLPLLFSGPTACLFAVMLLAPAQAQTVTTLYSFAGPEGALPQGALVAIGGTFYGTTYNGGASSQGTVFSVTPFGAVAALFSFTGNNGQFLSAGLALGTDGNLYGTTNSGGINTHGTAFQITPTGTLKTIYNFAGGFDAAYPLASLTLGSDGNFYGTTQGGGLNGGFGTIFSLTASGTLTVLHSFAYGDGSSPAAGLTLGNDGNFYGTTQFGGALTNSGTIFQITSAGVFTLLHSFNGADGSQPTAELVQGSDGTLYGATSLGGLSNAGTLFKISPAKTFSSTYSFSGADGSQPVAAMAFGPDGKLYGSTKFGGTSNVGTLFMVDTAGVFTNLVSFTGANGSQPAAALMLAPDGSFYGTTSSGGTNDEGTIFNLQLCLAGPKRCAGVSTVSSLNPSTYGDAATLTATVTPSTGSGIPTGAVGFSDAGNVLGNVLLAGGKASLTTSTLSVGQHPVTVSYSGDATFRPATGTFLQVVNPVGTATGLVSTVNPSTFNQGVTFTATVAPVTGSGISTGTITFKDGTQGVGVVPLVAGLAKFSPQFLAAGSHSLTAIYSGDANNLASSGALSQSVNQATTTVGLSTTAGLIAINQTVTFKATVTGQYAGVPSGTVSFFQNGTLMGHPVSLTSRQAAVTTSFASPGTYSITAVYSGDTNFLSSSTTAPLTEQVDLTSTTTLQSTLNPATFNQSVTFTATVATAPGFATPTGKVIFMDGQRVLGAIALSGGSASVTPAALGAGPHTIAASYTGDTLYLASSTSLAQTINPAATTIGLTSSVNPTPVSQPVTFIATVAGQYAGNPTGTVNFYQDGTLVGASVAVTARQAKFTQSFAAPGSYAISAVYSGDGNFATSTTAQPIPEKVGQVSTVTLSSSANPSVHYQPVTFTAAVAAVGGSPTPTGTIVFSDGSQPLASVPLTAGSAALHIGYLSTGTHSLTAAYSGDANYLKSSRSLTQVVNHASSTIGLKSTANPSFGSGPVTFTATVFGQFGGTPSGTVTFASNGTQIGSSVAVVNGTAAITTNFAASNTYAITAAYSGDTNYLAATGSLNEVVYVTVTTTTTLRTSGTPALVGTPVTFTAIVHPVAGKIKDGETVTFSDGASALGFGLTAAGAATFTTSSLVAGPHSITATYAGDAIDLTSTSATLNQVINRNATTTALASSQNPSLLGQPVTFIATVTSAGPAPTGTVTFKNGTKAIGSATVSSGAAALTITKLAVGTDPITATYGGDGLSAGSVSGVLEQVVNPGN